MDNTLPRIVAETPSYLVAFKPAGLHTAPLQADETNTLLAWVIMRYPEVAQVSGQKPVEPGLLHRLDRETSGLVLIARTESSYRNLCAAHEAGKIFKQYSAFVVTVGPDTKDEAVWRATVARATGIAPCYLLPVLGTRAISPGKIINSRFRAFGPGSVRVVPVPAVVPPPGQKLKHGETRESYTTRVLSVGPVIRQATGTCRWVRVELKKGFRHQVRLHLAASGLPIAGDPLYLAPEFSTPFDQMHLYADGLQFPSPDDAKTVRVQLPPVKLA
jgi:23S rRNA pseudouridine1911/1915/1917 synthase